MIQGDANIAWIDVETSGLDPVSDFLLEIAVLVTDKDLNILDEVGYQSVVKYDPHAAIFVKAKANEFVTEMHTKTGLWDKITGPGAKHLEQIDRELAAYLAQFGEPGMMPIAGNSVRLDANFVEANLPKVYAHLDYHMRDVSTVAGLAEGWYGQDNFVKFNDHTAMTDTRESIRELKHYRETVFRPVSETAVHSADGKMHERWLTASREDLLDALRFQGAMTQQLLNNEKDFEAWKSLGRANGWISESVCISHDMIPMTPQEQDEDDPCVHVLRLYPDVETKKAAEEA